MRKLGVLLAGLVGLMLVSGFVWASDYYEATSDGTLVAVPCVVKQVIVVADGTNACSATLRDGGSSGAKLGPTWTVGAGDNNSGFVIPDAFAKTNVYLDISTTGTCTVGVWVDEK